MRELTLRRGFSMIAALAAGIACRANAAPPAHLALGQKVDDFTVRDFRGAERKLSEFKESKAVVVAFLGTECPVAKAYGTRLAKLAAEFEPQEVAFLGLFANQQDGITAIGQFAKDNNLKFTLAKDINHAVADKLHAERTPHVFVLDAENVVRYCGRIDDEYEVGVKRVKPTRRDLAEALDELLAGKEVSVPVTAPVGCPIGRLKKPDDSSPITYSKQIARIFQDRCERCHRPGEAGPFSLTKYEDAAGWSDAIAEVIRDERMPPWHANPKYGTFRNDVRLTDDEKQSILAWVKAGAPQGNPNDLPPPKQYTTGWQIPKPDAVFYIADKPFAVKAEGEVKYQYFMVDPGFKEDKWIQAAECRAGNREVVHHMLVYAKPQDKPGEKTTPVERPGVTLAKRDADFPQDWLAAMAPGSKPMILPPGLAKKVPAGSKFIFQMHYTPNGKAQTDRSSIGLVFANPATVKKEVTTWRATNPRFLIPPGADNYKVEAEHKFGKDTLLLAMFPHTHLRGKAFRYEAIYPDGKTEILLDVPRYDFNWQNAYEFAAPLKLPAGTKLHCTAWYDNSAKNLANPDPKAWVKWGDQTWEEMMIGYFAMCPAE